jgi:5-methylcytosine-specific restriction endonuclease McrA
MLKVCAEAGCTRLIESSRCEQHKRIERQDAEHHKFYESAAWRKFRLWYAARHPKQCTMCMQHTTRVALDHIVPILQGGERFNENNVRWLCFRCHNKVRKEAR